MGKYDLKNPEGLEGMKFDFLGDDEIRKDMIAEIRDIAEDADNEDGYKFAHGGYFDDNYVEGERFQRTDDYTGDTQILQVSKETSLDGILLNERVEYTLETPRYEHPEGAHLQINYGDNGEVVSKEMYYINEGRNSDIRVEREIEVKFGENGSVEVISSYKEEDRTHVYESEQHTEHRFYENGELVRTEYTDEYRVSHYEFPNEHIEVHTTETYADGDVSERISVRTEHLEGQLAAEKETVTIDRYEDGKIVSSEEIHEVKIIGSDGEPIARFVDVGDTSRVECNYDTDGRLVEKIEYEQTRDGETEVRVTTYEFSEDGEVSCTVMELAKDSGEMVEVDAEKAVETYEEAEKMDRVDNYEFFQYDPESDVSPDNEETDPDKEINPDDEIFDTEYDSEDGE